MKHRLHSLLMGCMLVLLACGLLSCTRTSSTVPSSGAEEEFAYHVYYMNLQENDLYVKSYTAAELGVEQGNLEAIAKSLIAKMYEVNIEGATAEYKSVFTEEEGCSKLELENNVAKVHLNGYQLQSNSYEVLKRAAIAKTLTEVEGIESVFLMVGDQPVMDFNQQPMAMFTAKDFVSVVGKNVNQYTRTTLMLYFADETGTKLKSEQIDITYSGNFSLEEYAIERLIQGPQSADCYPTMSSSVNILSVNVTDGTCYVNFDNSFLEQSQDIDANLTIYSIVNTLTEFSNINNVRITVDGASNIVYKDTVNLDAVLERNLDYYETE